MPASYDFPIADGSVDAVRDAARPQRNSPTGAFAPDDRRGSNRAAHSQRAGAEMDRIGRGWSRAIRQPTRTAGLRHGPRMRLIVGRETREYLQMLLGAVLFVLLIACANVANLQFARATGRHARGGGAHGARRDRDGAWWRSWSPKACCSSVGGAALGLLIAKWGVNMMRGGMPAEVEKYILGWRQMGSTGARCCSRWLPRVASGVLAGLAPAWQCSRPNLSNALKEGGRGGTAGKSRHRLRNILVAAEIALAVVLLVGAGLMVRGFRGMMKNGAALEPSTLLTMRLAHHRPPNITRPTRSPRSIAQVVDGIQALPGVTSAAAVIAMPYSDHSRASDSRSRAARAEPGDLPDGMYQVASPSYFATLHVPLRAGRLLQESDGPDAPPVAVVSERMAQRWLPNESPIGKRIRIGGNPKKPWMTIVGVVGDVVHNAYDRQPRPTFYVPYQQAPATWMDIGVRTAGDPLRLAPAVTGGGPLGGSRAAGHGHAHDGAVDSQRRPSGLNYVAALMGVFGGLALVLSAIGVYGVMAHLVSDQTHEIGIRMALGASRGSVLGMILRRGMLTTAVGPGDRAAAGVWLRAPDGIADFRRERHGRRDVRRRFRWRWSRRRRLAVYVPARARDEDRSRSSPCAASRALSARGMPARKQAQLQPQHCDDQGQHRGEPHTQAAGSGRDETHQRRNRRAAESRGAEDQAGERAPASAIRVGRDHHGENGREAETAHRGTRQQRRRTAARQQQRGAGKRAGQTPRRERLRFHTVQNSRRDEPSEQDRAPEDGRQHRPQLLRGWLRLA